MDTNKTPPEGLAGRKKPRLTAMERLAIEMGLDAGKTLYCLLFGMKLGDALSPLNVTLPSSSPPTPPFDVDA